MDVTPPYEAPGPGPVKVVADPETNGLALASFVIGVVSLVAAFFFSFAFSFDGSLLVIYLFVPVTGFLCGLMARNTITAARGAQRGAEMAVAGLILTVVAGLLALFIYLEIQQQNDDFSLLL